MTKSQEEAVITKHERLIRSIALSLTNMGTFASFDDLLQEGRVALLLAARNWDPNRGASIWTYARRFVLGAMFAAAKSHFVEDSAAEKEAEIPDTALSAEESVMLFELIGRLSPRELEIVKSLASGETLEHIGDEIGLSFRGVKYVGDGAMRKMREAA